MTKKALVIGVNYLNQPNTLKGCANDAWHVANFLTNNYDYPPENIRILTDDPNSHGELPEWLMIDNSDEEDSEEVRNNHDSDDSDDSDDEESDSDDKSCSEDDSEDDKKDKKKNKEKKKDKKKKKSKKDKKKDKKKKKSKKDKKKKKKKKKKDKKRELEGDFDVNGTSESESDNSDSDSSSEELTRELVCTGYNSIHHSIYGDENTNNIQSQQGYLSATQDARHQTVFQMLPATKKSIIEGCKWLVEGTQEGDSCFFHYSGHGIQVEDQNGDEDDGKDEAICPADFRVAGVIIDDDLHDLLVKPLPKGVRLTAIMDCCHSGTALDLDYEFEAKKQKKKDKKKEKKLKKKNKKKKKKSDEEEPEHGAVVMLSGCQDHQTSADVVFDGTATGAMSFALITALVTHNMSLRWCDLLDEIRKILSKRVKKDQFPVLSTDTEDFDFGSLFIA